MEGRHPTAPAEASAPITIPRALLRWWRENLPRLGLTRTTGMFLGEMWEFLRNATPHQRKQRYGDVDFDWDHRVDTTSANVRRRTDLLAALAGYRYQPSDPAIFHQSIRSLSIDYSQFDFVDLGSGKGRSLLMASEYPFRRILGVEAVPALHRIALENIRKYKSESRQCFQVESVCSDARDFQLPNLPLVLYLFNPLPEAGLQAVVKNLRSSLREHPRPLYVVYQNPLLEHVLTESDVLRKVSGNLQYAVFEFQVSSV